MTRSLKLQRTTVSVVSHMKAVCIRGDAAGIGPMESIICWFVPYLIRCMRYYKAENRKFVIGMKFALV